VRCRNHAAAEVDGLSGRQQAAAAAAAAAAVHAMCSALVFRTARSGASGHAVA
jgi:hypothetical protein